jgi:DNA-binding NarL/FixJ family response regulator
MRRDARMYASRDERGDHHQLSGPKAMTAIAATDSTFFGSGYPEWTAKKHMPKKPGPPPYKPTATQRRRVMRGIAVGLTMQQLADDLGVSERTVRRAFGNEIKKARVRLILDNLDRLHTAADNGNVAAMKTLAQMMQPRTDRDHDDTEDDDTWADVVPNLAGNLEIH